VLIMDIPSIFIEKNMHAILKMDKTLCMCTFHIACALFI
jgi:hypothetical protein